MTTLERQSLRHLAEAGVKRQIRTVVDKNEFSRSYRVSRVFKWTQVPVGVAGVQRNSLPHGPPGFQAATMVWSVVIVRDPSGSIPTQTGKKNPCRQGPHTRSHAKSTPETKGPFGPLSHATIPKARIRHAHENPRP